MKKYNLVLFAGGKGTRMGSLSEKIPKPMIMVNGKPLIDRVIDLYDGMINKVIICAGYKHYIIEEYFKENNFVEVINTGLDSGTAKRLSKISHLIETETFFLNYSDAISDVSISDMLRFHEEKKSALTMLSVNPPTTFGVIESDKNEKILRFDEKKNINNIFINAGFFICNKSIIKTVSNVAEEMMFEDPCVMKRIINQGSYSYKYNGFWQCADTIKDIKILEDILD